MRIRRAATRFRGLAELSAMTASSCSAVVWYLPVVDDPIRRKAIAYLYPTDLSVNVQHLIRTGTAMGQAAGQGH